MAKGELPSGAPEPRTRHMPSKKEGGAILDNLLSNPDYIARIEQAQADQDAGNLRSLEDVRDVLGIPHESQEPDAESGRSIAVGIVDERNPEAMQAATDATRAEIAAGGAMPLRQGRNPIGLLRR